MNLDEYMRSIESRLNHCRRAMNAIHDTKAQSDIVRMIAVIMKQQKELSIESVNCNHAHKTTRKFNELHDALEKLLKNLEQQVMMAMLKYS